jgi:predicted O-linked N-acetylglucosamine transferase (SPINDLY family)
MGVPVITLRGDRHAGRVGASILTRTGLAELVAEDEEAYVRIAMELARDLDRLERLRSEMRARVQQSPLCDGKGFARAMEYNFETVWKHWCRKNMAARHNSESDDQRRYTF